AVGVAWLAGVEVTVVAECRSILALGGLGGIGLVLERRSLRIGFAEHVGCFGAGVHQRRRERCRGQARGSDLDETAAPYVGSFGSHGSSPRFGAGRNLRECGSRGLMASGSRLT